VNNKQSTITYLILIITPFVFSCRGPVKEENKNNTLASSLSVGAGNEKYVINTNESVVTWKGSNLMGSNTHRGYVYVSKGELIIKNGNLIGGTAEVDMNTIEDEKHAKNNGLVDHLKEPDFFDVKKFPSSTIVLAKAVSINNENRKVAGNLTIKGITQPVTFPANVEVTDGIVKLKGRLVIDRTKWDIRYKSGKFYDLLADQTISDSIEFHVKIVARK
jgi:polyisoprenoid-binding protein YceI